MSVSSVMGYLKRKEQPHDIWAVGKSRYQYRNREFWCRGYYVDTTGENTQKIKEYIANQSKEDQLNGQLAMEEVEPFMGSK